MRVLLADGVQVVHYVTNGRELTDVVVVDLDAEAILAEHNQVSQLNGVDSEVTGKLSLHGNVVAVDLKLIDQKICKLF